MSGIPASPDRLRARGAIGLIVALVVTATLFFASSSQAATAIGLGTADSYALLAGSGVTNTGPSVVNGDLGTSPTPAVTGFGGAPDGTVNGVIHQADAAADQAQADLTTAYDNAAGQGPATLLATELGGQTLTPGVYDSASGTFGITGTLTLDAQGDPNAVFIFKTATTLISGSSSQVNVINGAQPCNLYWKVGSSATLGTSSAFAGNILALQSISVNDGVSVNGRLLARNGAVTLINDTITRPTCATGGTGGGTGGSGGGGGGVVVPPVVPPVAPVVPPVVPPVAPPVGGGGTGGGGGNGGGTGGGGSGGGNGGGHGGGGTGSAGGGGGSPGSPTAHITRIPGGGGSGHPPVSNRCTKLGFRAHFRIVSKYGLRRVSVYVGGEIVKRTNEARFSVWIPVRGLRSGRTKIRVVAVDGRGRHSAATGSFRRCAPVVVTPPFTG